MSKGDATPGQNRRWCSTEMRHAAGRAHAREYTPLAFLISSMASPLVSRPHVRMPFSSTHLFRTFLRCKASDFNMISHTSYIHCGCHDIWSGLSLDHAVRFIRLFLPSPATCLRGKVLTRCRHLRTGCSLHKFDTAMKQQRVCTPQERLFFLQISI